MLKKRLWSMVMSAKYRFKYAAFHVSMCVRISQEEKNPKPKQKRLKGHSK